MRILFFALSLPFLLLACQNTPVKVVDNMDRLALDHSDYPDQATIYVLRSTGMAGAINPDRVFVDDVALGSIRRGRYIKLPLTPGVHVVKIRNGYPLIGGIGGIDFQGDFAENKTYYFVVGHDATFSGSFTTFTTRLEQLSNWDAKALMETYKPGTVYEQVENSKDDEKM